MNLTSERNVLGAVLEDDSNWQHVASLSPDDFSIDRDRWLFSEMHGLVSKGQPINFLTVTEALQRSKRLEQVGGVPYLEELTQGVVAVPLQLKRDAASIRQAAILRRLAHGAQAVAAQAAEPGASVSAILGRLADLAATPDGDSTRIQTFAAIPDVFECDISEPSYLASGLVPRDALILLAGEPGIGKSYLVQRLAISCALGTRFLGRECGRLPVLYLDRENPGSIVRERIQAMAFGPVPGLKIWGGWLDDPPPNLDDARLLAIAREQKPLLVVDSLIRFHSGDENDAGDMGRVMAKLRDLVNAGATLLVIHHKGKGEAAASYRGSSDIGGGPDVVFSLSRDQCGLLTLRHVKNRFGAEQSFCIRPDYEAGTFELTEAPATAERREHEAELAAIISAEPGINTRGILAKAKESGMPKNDALRLLQSGTGRDWRVEDGPQRSKKYYPIADCSSVPEQFQNS